MRSRVDTRSFVARSSTPLRRILLYLGIAFVGFLIFAISQNTQHVHNAVAAAQNWYGPERESLTFSPYETTKDSSGESLPKPTEPSKHVRKAVVASTVDQEADACDWVRELLPGWEPFIYQIPPGQDKVDIATIDLWRDNIRLEKNIGREASVYLSFIIENYENLPDYVVFIHGKRYQTHNDDPMYDTLPLVRNLSLAHVTSQGYAPLRCNWKECPHIKVVPDPGHQDDFWDYQGLYAEAWMEFFPNTTMPTGVSAPCCAQFAVTREVIQRWPREQYVRMRDWTWAAPSAIVSVKMGVVFEFMWHLIFGKEQFFCPSAKECYCEKWNLCDLDCADEGWCHGRVWLKDAPHDFPEGWPESGQDGKEWPYWGWWDDAVVSHEH